MSLSIFLVWPALFLAQMSEPQVEQAADTIATAVEEQTPTGQMIESVPEPFMVPGQAQPPRPPGAEAAPSFEQADADGDGLVTLEEFSRMIKAEKFAAHDADGDDHMSQEEARVAAEKVAAQAQPTEPGKTPRPIISIPFSEIDADGDGKLSRDEVLQAVRKQPKVQTIFDGIAGDPDQAGGRPPGVSLDQWNNYENVGGGLPLLQITF